MTCEHPNCTGAHRTSGSVVSLCPAALGRRRANQLTRYHNRYKEKAREQRRAYYLANREQLLAKVKSYYRTHRAQSIAAACERTRKSRLAGIIYRPTRPKAKKEPDRNWWRVAESDKPRRWLMEAELCLN